MPGLAEKLSVKRTTATELEALRQSRKSFLFPAPGLYREVEHKCPHDPYGSKDSDTNSSRRVRSLLESLPDLQTR